MKIVSRDNYDREGPQGDEHIVVGSENMSQTDADVECALLNDSDFNERFYVVVPDDYVLPRNPPDQPDRTTRGSVLNKEKALFLLGNVNVRAMLEEVYDALAVSEAACAAMRVAFGQHSCGLHDGHPNNFRETLAAFKSVEETGKGWVSPETYAALKKERDEWEAQVTEVCGKIISASGIDPDGHNVDDAINVIALDRESFRKTRFELQEMNERRAELKRQLQSILTDIGADGADDETAAKMLKMKNALDRVANVLDHVLQLPHDPARVAELFPLLSLVDKARGR